MDKCQHSLEESIQYMPVNIKEILKHVKSKLVKTTLSQVML